MKKTIAVVDDQKDLCQAIRFVLEANDFGCADFQDGEAFQNCLEKEYLQAVLLDLNLGKGQVGGLELLERIRKADPALPVIILTADTTVKAAVDAMKLGAYHYLTKPFDNDEMLLLIRKAVEERDKTRQIEILKARAPSPKTPTVIGRGKNIQDVQDLVKKIAPTELTVILEGESGSGKELFANLIHALSARRDGPFVSLDCGTLQESLLESELFGYEKGAFTGADRRKLGQFEIAQGGTLFLDEIGNLSSAVQAKLLRVLQERKIQHLGGHREIEIDIRVLCASNIPLETLTKRGKFREDLFHRLNQFSVSIPPLRKRLDDIEDLAGYFLKCANQEMSKNISGFTRETLSLMKSYSWPGNIRELRNSIYRAAILADNEVRPEHLQLSMTRNKYVEKTLADSQMGKKISLKKASRHAAGVLEKQLIEQTLKKCNNNKSLAAKKLRIDRKALYNKLKKFKISTKR